MSTKVCMVRNGLFVILIGFVKSRIFITESLQSRLQNAKQSKNDRAAESEGAERRKRKRLRIDYGGIFDLSICNL